MSEVPKKRIRDVKYPHEKVGLLTLRLDSDYYLIRTDIKRERIVSRSYTAIVGVQSEPTFPKKRKKKPKLSF